MDETADAARFGTTLKVLGSIFYWVAGFAAVIAFVANRHLTFEPFLKYGLPALILVVGIVAGSLLRASGYALRLLADRSAASHRAEQLTDA